MTTTLLKDYGTTLESLVCRTHPVREAAVELGRFGEIEAEKLLVTVTRKHIKAALADYADGRMSRDELRLWAELLPDRPGIRFERRYATRIRTVLGDLQGQKGNTWFSVDDQVEEIGQFLDIPDRPLRYRLLCLGFDRVTVACFTIMFQSTLIAAFTVYLPESWPRSVRVAVTVVAAFGTLGLISRATEGWSATKTRIRASWPYLASAGALIVVLHLTGAWS